MEEAFVLVHGSWHSGESWDRVAMALRGAGHRVLTPTLTGHGPSAGAMTPDVGLYTHIDDVRRLIDAEDLRGVILVGHSYGGLVISGVADAMPERVAQLVYIDAIVPENGESAVDVMPGVFQPLVDRVSTSATPWLIPPPPASPEGIFGISDEDDVAWIVATLTPQSVRSWVEPVRLDNRAADAIPRTHIHCALHPRASERRPVPAVQPNGAPSQVWDIQSGHDCMVIAPRQLTELLLSLTASHETERVPLP